MKINFSHEEKTDLLFDYLMKNNVGFRQFVFGKDEQFKQFEVGEDVIVLDEQNKPCGLANIVKFNIDGTVNAHFISFYGDEWPDKSEVVIYGPEDEENYTDTFKVVRLKKQDGIVYRVTMKDYFNNGSLKKKPFVYHTLTCPAITKDVISIEQIDLRYTTTCIL